MSQLDVKILHQDYVLTCPDGKESQLLEAVERVDNQFETMRESSKLRSRERIGVLLSVNLAFENLELRQQLQTLQQQLALRGDWTAGDDELPATDTTAHATQQALQALQAQVAHDAVLAAQLLARVDAALTATAPTTDEPMPAEVVQTGAVEAADAVGGTDATDDALLATDGLALADHAQQPSQPDWQAPTEEGMLDMASSCTLAEFDSPAPAAEIGLFDCGDGNNLTVPSAQAL